ncbi:uncharacterized protein CIMG_08742 [Coccidioides immitis RS]|uniref:Uncharacterized protein n=1 Tax=Coccidioides immitis (strain RS) TaxID=246410 RepID=J3K641_COCIM|nr:uncharacterized protein CIMG_08742 [Coccidioides immitis RS]EAS29996.3 hypothetical protein CIMG_08742 [Coccidioides immitis RS]
MQSGFWQRVRQNATDLHERRVNELDFIKSIVELVASNKDELPEVFISLKEAFKKQKSKTSKAFNREQALSRFLAMKKKDFDPPQGLLVAIPKFTKDPLFFWNGGVKESKETFGNIISFIYHSLERIKIWNGIHRAFHALAIYELVQQFMALYESNTFTEQIREAFADFILGKDDLKMRQTVISNVQSEYKKGATYCLYAKILGHGCFFYMFNSMPPYIYETYLHSKADIQKVSAYYQDMVDLEDREGADQAGKSIMKVIIEQFKHERSMIWIKARKEMGKEGRRKRKAEQQAHSKKLLKQRFSLINDTGVPNVQTNANACPAASTGHQAFSPTDHGQNGNASNGNEIVPSTDDSSATSSALRNIDSATPNFQSNHESGTSMTLDPQAYAEGSEDEEHGTQQLRSESAVVPSHLRKPLDSPSKIASPPGVNGGKNKDMSAGIVPRQAAVNPKALTAPTNDAFLNGDASYTNVNLNSHDPTDIHLDNLDFTDLYLGNLDFTDIFLDDLTDINLTDFDASLTESRS